MILAYQAKDYDEFVLPLGKFIGERGPIAARYEHTHCRGQDHAHRVWDPTRQTTLEVFRIYQQALESAGFQTLYACASTQCGRIALYAPTFDTDSATLTGESASTLGEMAKYLASNPAAKVYIVGHTDSTASLAHNLDLSQRRADAVAKALVTQHGVAAMRLATKRLASYAPVTSNRDAAGRAKNRRVEMVEQ